MATKRRASKSLDKAIQFTVRFSEKEWELARRISTILYRGVFRDFVARAIVERCVAVGTIKLPGAKPLPLPKDARSIDEALAHLAAYQDALAKRIEEPKAFFIRPATRLHLVKALASFPHGVAAPYAQPPYRKLAADPADADRPASLALQPMQMAAAKDAAGKMTDGNFTTFVIDAMTAKAEGLGMRSVRAVMPAFRHYPAPQLLQLQRNIEEPALALVVAHQEIAGRAKVPVKGVAAESVRRTCDRLLERLLTIEVEATSA